MRYIELPPGLAYRLEQAAEQAGVSPEVYSELLLNLALAFRNPGASSAFGKAVWQFLGQRTLDPALFSSAFTELVQHCLGTAGTAPPAAIAEWREKYAPVPYGLMKGEPLMVRETPVHAYTPSAPAPVVRASALGRYANVRAGSAEFARAKQAEIVLEDRPRP